MRRGNSALLGSLPRKLFSATYPWLRRPLSNATHTNVSTSPCLSECELDIPMRWTFDVLRDLYSTNGLDCRTVPLRENTIGP